MGPEEGMPVKGFANTAVTGLIIAVFCCLLASHPTHSATPPYPAWAAAVAPDYPNALPSSGLVLPNVYNVATTDRFETVVAWYKSRVRGAWAETEGGNTWYVKIGGVEIQVSRNFYDDSGNEKPGTRVAITHTR